MKKRLSVALAAVLALSAIAGVSQATAATEIGSTCAGEEIIPASLISLGHGAGSPLPVAAPSSGIITQWAVNLNYETEEDEEDEFFSRLFRQNFNVYKPSGPNAYTLVSQTEGGPLNLHGTNVYQARIPVEAGDVIGLGAPFAFFCASEDPADRIAYTFEKMPVGSTHTFSEEERETGIQVPVSAKIEPDVDGDGYGDETQDQCPQSAAYQTACPVVTISSLPSVAKKAVTLHVATSLSAPVGVTATVALGKGKTAALTAATQTVAAGVLTPFTLTLTPQVTKALKQLPTKKSLQMSITASATNVTGSPSTTASTVKLKGEAKPVHHKKKKKTTKK